MVEISLSGSGEGPRKETTGAYSIFDGQSRTDGRGELVHHSDRGSQYASGDYQQALGELGVVCSMSRKGNCWDNAVAESFFATLKTECVHARRFATKAEAREVIFDFVEVFYNRGRRHSTIGYMTPVEFEMKFIEERKLREYEAA
jgi:putative transposase